jgi:hypothetical protein
MIRRFFTSIRMAWSLHRFEFSIPESWDNEVDAKNWKAFTSTPTGKKLVKILDWKRAQIIAEATLQSPGSSREFACGRAQGFNEVMLLVAQLSPPVRVTKQDETKEALTGAEDLLERFAP